MVETQNEQVLRLLRQRPEGLTALEALQLVGSMRLAARVADLKAQGHDIEAEMVKVNGGKRVARYRLTEQTVLWQR